METDIRIIATPEAMRAIANDLSRLENPWPETLTLYEALILGMENAVAHARETAVPISKPALVWTSAKNRALDQEIGL